MASKSSKQEAQLHPHPPRSHSSLHSRRSRTPLSSQGALSRTSQRAASAVKIAQPPSQTIRKSLRSHSSSASQRRSALLQKQKSAAQTHSAAGAKKVGLRMQKKEEKRLVLETHLDPLRVLPNSKVNFDRLTDEEMTQRYLNRFKELQDLRASFEKVMASQKPEPKLKKLQRTELPASLNLFKMARDLVRTAHFEIRDCRNVLDELVKAVAGKTLKPEGEEMQLICSIVRRVMSESGRPANKRTNSLIAKTLREASKQEIVDFVTKKGSKLKKDALQQSLLLQRPSQSIQPQFMPYCLDSRTPSQMAYIVKPNQNLGLPYGTRSPLMQGGRAGESVALLPFVGGAFEGHPMGVTRLSAVALKKFDEEHGQPLPLG